MKGQELFDYLKGLIANGHIILLDISHWQGNVDFQKLKNLGIAGVYLKVGDPWMVGWEDPTFQDYRFECRRVGLAWGGYWYFRPEYDGIQQAKRMLEIMGNDRGSLPLAGDVEYQLTATRTMFRRRLKEFYDILFTYDRRIPGLYTRATFLDPELGWEPWMSRLWTWIANYDEVEVPLTPIATIFWTMHQRWADGDELGDFLGIESNSVDVDLFNGTLTMFFAWARTGRFPDGEGSIYDPPVLPPPQPDPPVPTPIWGTGTIKVSLRLRDAPITGATLAIMSIGASVVILAAPVGGWVNVRYNGISGWCSANPTYITIVERI